MVGLGLGRSVGFDRSVSVSVGSGRVGLVRRRCAATVFAVGAHKALQKSVNERVGLLNAVDE